MAKSGGHPTVEQLRAFGLGQLRPSEALDVERHVEHCESCCLTLADVPDDAVLAKIKQCDTVNYQSQAEADAVPLESETARGNIPAALLDHPRYRIINLLGWGGMGVVYKAEHRVMERPVALKVISRRFISNPLAVERFQREVRTAARLTHPNIVVAHDADQAGDLHFLVMEFVDGMSLAQLVERKGPLPTSTASTFVRQAALGLQAAAQQGMVHRDIKPQNLMLTRKGQVKILDFGLARFAREESLSGLNVRAASDSSRHLDGGLTQAGMIVGTPDYMAPEQAENSSTADIRADIYSLGCTLFFLLTGQPPFEGDSITRTLKSHADRRPPNLNQLRDDLPIELVRIVERMMAKDPADRFATPAEVAKALAPFAVGGLAALGAMDATGSKRAIPVLPRVAATLPDEAPSTVELMRRRHWRTLWNRTQYEYRKFFRLPHRRSAAGVVAVVLLIGLIAGLMEWSQRASQATANQRPAASVAVPEPPAVPRQPRIALVVSQRDFFVQDYLAMRQLLQARGVVITVLSSRTGTATPKQFESRHIDDVPVDRSLADIRPGDFEALIFISGGSPDFLARSPLGETVRQRLQEQLDHGTYLAALQNAVAIFADHGLLNGQSAAAQDWITKATWFDHGGVLWDTLSPIVASGPEGRLLTARTSANADLLVTLLLDAIDKKRKR